MLASGAGDGWVILNMDYLEEFLETEPESFGGFHGSSRSQPYLGWEKYIVAPVHKDEDDELGAWEKFVNTTVSCSAVSNSGVVRSEEDFEDMRRKCVNLQCGGFAWRKPHFNQFLLGGESENIVFFFPIPPGMIKENQIPMTNQVWWGRQSSSVFFSTAEGRPISKRLGWSAFAWMAYIRLLCLVVWHHIFLIFPLNLGWSKITHYFYYFIIFLGLVWKFAGSNTIESDVWSPRNHDTFWYPLVI